MSEITYISEELVMEGSLDSAGSSVVLAGRFKGEIRAKDVLLESGSIFDGNLIIKLNLPFGLDWEDNKIIINHEMNLYEMIYGMDININLGFKEIRINSWTPVRDGYKIDLEDIKIGNHYLQIKFNLNYNHTDDKKKILQNYFRD